jgi:diaminopimelate epimerase
MIPAGRTFYKMSGSGNDFVMIDARNEPRGRLADPAVVQRVCARGTGVGADGIVFLEPSSVANLRLVYLNADGSRAEFCGNATLCTARLATELGGVDAKALAIETDSGVIAARIGSDPEGARSGLPEIDLPPVTDVRDSGTGIPTTTGEYEVGFATVGVPHLVILCGDVSTVDVAGRGRPLRSHPSLAKGANVNWVSRASDGRWRMRTYERGVEVETLACGSGAVATAILLTLWGQASGAVEIRTSSGATLRVRLGREESCWLPRLTGEARVVYKGQLSEI